MAAQMFQDCAFIAVTTTDLVSVREFWVTLLGFPVVREDDEFLMVNACGVRICFDLPEGDIHQPGTDAVIGLKVEDLEVTLEALAARGVRAAGGPFQDHHGKWAKLLDPDGRTVIVTERG
jgi:catechol 2,3-dioxygenase-like lactoylglutathione lyase family enzyme